MKRISQVKRLTSGKTYPLKDIFSGQNNKVIIPDLQRDYCWGDTSINLVGQFMESLLEMDKSDSITMGLLYGYYNQYTLEHLQLCDGQQRLTTLFLLLGVLNKKMGDNSLRQHLISEFELELDDQEPYLQYAIRESSMVFLSDLTVHYFLKNEEYSVEDIKHQPWFFSDYHLDPTIISALRALSTITEKLEGLDKTDLKELADFILTKLEFLFLDMGTRENGEETFVIINTTGEPLSPIQNLKPLVIEQNIDNNPNVASQWEEMETWFWQHRRRDAEYKHTSDEGMDCFFHIVRILNAGSEDKTYEAIDNSSRFPYQEISFDFINRAFLAYKKLYELDFSERKDANVCYPTKQKYYTQQSLYSICPTLLYYIKYPSIEDDDIKRVYHLFSNMSRYRDVARSQDNNNNRNSPLFRAMQIVEKMESYDILSLHGQLPSEEENTKLDFIINALKDSTTNRAELEVLLADAESSSIFKGQISELLRWTDGTVPSLNFYWTKFIKFWHSDSNLDPLRRALLASPMKEYPISRQGYGTLLNFCYNDADWFTFIKKNSAPLKAFLDDERTLEERIESFDDEHNKMYILIKDAQWLQTSHQKNIYIYGDVLALMKKERTSSDYNIIYQNISYNKYLLYQYKMNWTVIWANEHCIYSDLLRYNLTLDYFVSPSGYRIVIWAGKHPEKDPYPNYEQLDKLGCFRNIDNHWEYPLITDGLEAKNKYQEFAKVIDDTLPL